MRDADQRPKQVVCIQISSQIATPFRPLHQPADRTLDQAARTLMKSGRTSGNGIESGRNDVICRNVIHQQEHPGSQRFNRGHGFGKAASGRREFLNFVPVNTFDQFVPRREVAVQGTRSNTRLLRDFLQTGIGALPGKGSRPQESSRGCAVRLCAACGGSWIVSSSSPRFLQPEATSVIY